MLRYLLAASLLLIGLTEASAQTTPRRAARKRVPYSVRAARKAGPGINPHTGRPYGAALAQHPDLKDQVYLAPGVPMRKRSTYLPHSSYSNRTPKPAAPRTNTTLSGSAGPAAPTAPAAKAKARL